MSGVTKKLMSASGGVAGGFTAIEDVFSTYLYTGNGSTQTITNGIDLAGEGGLVWFKRRDTTGNNRVYDTERGMTAATGGAPYLYTNDTAANLGTGFAGSVVATSTGFDITQGAIGDISDSGGTYASWTFRKAPRFFDVVTYTGTGSAQTIAHNLGTTVGSVIVKRTDAVASWGVYHRGLNGGTNAEQYYILLNSTSLQDQATVLWNDTAPTDSVFTVGTNAAVNASGGTYVAYLFAHDPLGPSGDGSDGLIDCGSFSLSGGTGSVNLGWEPQFVLVKQSDGTGNWYIHDTMRGMALTADASLSPNTSSAEATYVSAIIPNATGFVANGGYFPSSGNYIYIAIRRGPMRAPESGTEVFAPAQYDGTKFPTGFPVDFAIAGNAAGTDKWYFQSRLQGPKVMSSHSTAGEFGSGSAKFDLMDGYGTGFSTAYYSTAFRRAPEFFDVVAYTGNSTAGRTVSHNLGVAPEMMIVKRRSADGSWGVYHAGVGASPATKVIKLNQIFGTQVVASYWNNTAPTESVFTVGSDGDVNASAHTYIAYLFATLAGVSKVGSYTGNGSSQTINCGFTTGARFILIKRTDSTGDWYVWDTARGMVAGNDPFLELNTTDAEVTSDDSIDPDSSGFIVNQTGTTNVNVSSASYIFMAIS